MHLIWLTTCLISFIRVITLKRLKRSRIKTVTSKPVQPCLQLKRFFSALWVRKFTFRRAKRLCQWSNKFSISSKAISARYWIWSTFWFTKQKTYSMLNRFMSFAENYSREITVLFSRTTWATMLQDFLTKSQKAPTLNTKLIWYLFSKTLFKNYLTTFSTNIHTLSTPNLYLPSFKTSV